MRVCRLSDDDSDARWLGKLLLTVSGIGEILGLTTMLEIREIGRFAKSISSGYCLTAHRCASMR